MRWAWRIFVWLLRGSPRDCTVHVRLDEPADDDGTPAVWAVHVRFHDGPPWTYLDAGHVFTDDYRVAFKCAEAMTEALECAGWHVFRPIGQSLQDAYDYGEPIISAELS